MPSTYPSTAYVDLQQISFLPEAHHTAVFWTDVLLACGQHAQLGFSEHSLDTRELSASQDLSVRDHIAPTDP